MARQLPTFEDIRVAALRLLGDAADELRSDWREGAGPNPAQADARRQAFVHIGHAKAALDEAARVADRPAGRSQVRVEHALRADPDTVDATWVEHDEW